MICERFVLALRPCPFSLLIRLLGLEPLYILISALEGNNWNSLLSAGVQAVRASSYAKKFGFVKILGLRAPPWAYASSIRWKMNVIGDSPGSWLCECCAR